MNIYRYLQSIKLHTFAHKLTFCFLLHRQFVTSISPIQDAGNDNCNAQQQHNDHNGNDGAEQQLIRGQWCSRFYILLLFYEHEIKNMLSTHRIPIYRPTGDTISPVEITAVGDLMHVCNSLQCAVLQYN